MELNRSLACGFKESDQEWRPVPNWARFLIRIGYTWPNSVSGYRRISLISLPCDSAAAGLVVLGALIRDLGKRVANDVDGHFDSLLRYANQYLTACRKCKSICKPSDSGCGYVAEANGLIRKNRKTQYQISESTNLRERRLALCQPKKSLTWVIINPTLALDLHISGQPSVQIGENGSLAQGMYERIIDDAIIIPDNLHKTYSGLCFAGRVAGFSSTRDACSRINFRFENGSCDLSRLLTIHGWSTADKISRVTFYNSRTLQFDRPVMPELVVADGDGCFIKVLSQHEFQQSDVIGVIHRTIERENLESLGDKITTLRQWFVEDSETPIRNLLLPHGIRILNLKRRT